MRFLRGSCRGAPYPRGRAWLEGIAVDRSTGNRASAECLYALQGPVISVYFHVRADYIKVPAQPG
jgi:hypothetical protein